MKSEKRSRRKSDVRKIFLELNNCLELLTLARNPTFPLCTTRTKTFRSLELQSLYLGSFLEFNLSLPIFLPIFLMFLHTWRIAESKWVFLMVVSPEPIFHAFQAHMEKKDSRRNLKGKIVIDTGAKSNEELRKTTIAWVLYVVKRIMQLLEGETSVLGDPNVADGLDEDP